MMGWVSAAYVAYKTVDAAIHTARGFFATYAGYSSFANNMFLYEVLVVLAYLFWSFMVIVLSTLTAAQLWSTLDKRMADANESV